MDGARWEVTHARDFRSERHINVQELSEICGELRRACRGEIREERLVNLGDSQVCVRVWGKGRSSSYMLNGLLRQHLGFQLPGRKCVGQVWITSAQHAADDPTRHKPLRLPKPVDSEVRELLDGQRAPADPSHTDMLELSAFSARARSAPRLVAPAHMS